MMQDSLARALGALKGARMDDVAADDVRKRLEQAWAGRAARRRPQFVVPGFARAFAVAALVVLVAFTTMRAAADNPLYGARVAVEDSLVAFQSDPVGYLSQLYTLPSPSPTPEVTAPPTESPTSPPTATPQPTVARTPTPKPATASPIPTPKPTTAPKPSPTPTPTPMNVHAYGYVLYADGSPVDGACVSTSLDGMCVAGSIKGRVDLQFTAKKGQSITLYFRNYDASRGGTLHGKVTVTIGGPEVALGTITLR